MANYDASAPTDIILPAKVRGPLLVSTWVIGTAIGAANVAYGYIVSLGGGEFPLWLGIVTTVFAFLSAQVNAIARANLNVNSSGSTTTPTAADATTAAVTSTAGTATTVSAATVTPLLADSTADTTTDSSGFTASAADVTTAVQ